MVAEIEQQGVCDLIKYILPTSINYFLLIIVICGLIYYIYLNQEEIINFKKKNTLYTKCI